MNKHAALLLLLPIVSWANELPPAKVEPKPIKPAESHAVPAPAPASEVKVASKHAAPQQMTEPIKLLKPAAEHAAPAPEEHAAAPEAMKPAAAPPVVRYVSPQFSSANAVHRPMVRSQAPHAARSRTSSTVSYAMKPGLVRVLPAAQIPSSAILPPAKGMQKSIAVAPTMANKPNVVWGATEHEPEMAKAPELAMPVAGRKIASPKFYTETNAELRWQYYSYP